MVLAEQQHKYLSVHLPQYSHTSKLITGSDRPDLWSTETWANLLSNVRLVVSTPQILLDGLRLAFLGLNQISLLVVDECHHATRKDPSNKIMQEFYKELRGSKSAPHILGMTASPITKKITGIKDLEASLDSVCRTPTRQLEEYQGYVHTPQFVTLNYPACESPNSLPVQLVLNILRSIDINEDPWVKQLLTENTPGALRRYEKVLETRSTYCMDQLKMLRGNTEHLYSQLGGWATHVWLREVLVRLRSKVERLDWMATLSSEEKGYLDSVLGEIRDLSCRVVTEDKLEHNLSAKASRLIDFLLSEYSEDISCVIFVERRSTAFALTKLLENHPLICYAVASFVGGSNSRKKDNLIDLADPAGQKTELEEFRLGVRSLVIATSVMEEGIDVQATNLVIRFDDSMNVRSYIQSRGRARAVHSKFVVMRRSGELSSKKYLDWMTLEAAMKAQYMDEERRLHERLKVEREDEEDGPVYTVSSTGAKLTFGNARGLLEHFCQKLKKVHLEPNPRPTFVCNGTHGMDMSAKVILPSSLPSGLREIQGSLQWRTEKAAKTDASFNAYVKLHKAGLVDDHLLPPLIPKKEAPLDTCAAFADIQGQMNPWQPISGAGDMLLHFHRFELEDAPKSCSPMLLLLPQKLSASVGVLLQYTKTRSVQARVVYSGSWITTAASRALAQRITSYLLSTALVSQSHIPECWSRAMPFYLLPDIPQDGLQDWYKFSRERYPLLKALKDSPALYGEQVLIYDNNNRAFLLDLPRNDLEQAAPLFIVHQDIPAVLAKKLPRRIDYLTRSNAPASMDGARSAVAVEGCVMEQLSSSLVETMQFIPSIIYMAGNALVSQACCDDILSSFHIADTRLVAEALTGPVAGGRENYERLEFFGDTLLKFYACHQVHADTDHGHLPEGYLTIEAMKIENNARLQRAAMELGLDRFMIHGPFMPKKWKPETRQSQEGQQQPSRQASTKTVADHVEALIAVAYLDDTGNYGGHQKATALLHGLFPEVQWNLPSVNTVATLAEPPAGTPSFEALSTVESMLGYKFKRRHLLAEALNHSTVSAHVTTYGRLEFLGDAVLQRIVNEAVYGAAPRYSQKAMHLRQIACVNHSYLAFLCFEAQEDVERVTVSTDRTQKDVTLGKTTETKYLFQFMSHSSMEVGPAQVRSLDRYLERRKEIRVELNRSQTYPWALLASIAAPKFFSDIVESVLGAVFTDCGADLAVCSKVLEKLGMMKLLRRLIEEPDMILDQPKTILWQERAKAGLPALKAVSRSRREAGGMRFGCQLLLEGEVYAQVDDAWCDEEAVLRVCEVVLKQFRKELQENKMPAVESSAS